VVKLNVTVEGGTIASLHGVRFSATYSCRSRAARSP
jgi:hypothetical protein